MGKWLKLNGAAIYDTRPWKIYGEGPTEVAQGHHSEKNNEDSGPEDIRFTTNGDTLYATALGWPENGTFNIKSLAKGNPYDSRKIASLKFISGSNKISWKQTNDGLTIKVRGKQPCEAAYAFQIQFK
jgi:alpha-L-fucosidase